LTYQLISVIQLREWLHDGKEIAVLDISEGGQFANAHILIASNIPPAQIEVLLSALVPRQSTRIILTSADATDAPAIAALMATAGYMDIHVLDGGNNAWKSAGFRLFSGINLLANAFGEVVEAECETPHIEAEELASWLADEKESATLKELRWSGKNLVVVREMLLNPFAVPGLSDGGAHVGSICDVSFPTTLLQWWGRDRPHGRIPLEILIERQCRATARAVGLADRGVILPGAKADLNLIDFDNLRLHAPQVMRDLPAGGRRLMQRAQGYQHTFVSGVEIMCNGEATGALPGKLVRGAQQLAVAASHKGS
jgi:rhodanese-related sulfurtransferase